MNGAPPLLHHVCRYGMDGGSWVFVNFEDLVPFLSRFCHLWNVCLKAIFHWYKREVIARWCPAQCVGWSNTLDLKNWFCKSSPHSRWNDSKLWYSVQGTLLKLSESTVHWMYWFFKDRYSTTQIPFFLRTHK